MNFRLKAKSPWVTAIIIMVVGIVLFTVGSVSIAYSEDRFTVKATGGALEIPYDKVFKIESREFNDNGQRTFGINTMKINSGSFTNEEFGTYSLHAYTSVKPVIVVHYTDDQILVFNLKTEEETTKCYQKLRTEWGK